MNLGEESGGLGFDGFLVGFVAGPDFGFALVIVVMSTGKLRGEEGLEVGLDLDEG